MRTGGITLFLTLLLAVSGCSPSFNPEFACAWGAKQAVRGQLRHPHTAKFDHFAGGEAMAYTKDREFYVVHTGVVSDNDYGGSIHTDFLLLMSTPKEGSEQNAQALQINQIPGPPTKGQVMQLAQEIAALDKWHWVWEKETWDPVGRKSD